ncbi:MAG: FAD-dependent oxidoreductase [Candidatus Sumerlaeota bacterium]|nr:FAD-dependent oxidoreductase [Candidatus Sumerlaeota bacterium]
MMYDLIIIGAGPAGITAGVYGARKRMNFLIISRDVGGQTSWSGDIENYIGYQFITGPELVTKFREHLEKFNVGLKVEEEVKLVRREGGAIHITSDKGEYEARTVIIASGRKPRMLGAEGEMKYMNRGVTYCATCDGPLFAGMDVAVVGGGNAGLDAVLQLINIANKIFVIEFTPTIKADPIMVEKAKASGKVTFYTQSKVETVYGDTFVKGIKVRREGELFELPVQGVFVEIGSMPVSHIAPDVKKNEFKEIIVDPKCRTNIEGIFAAGDVTDVPAKQIIVACGEGSKALLAAFEYLNTR